MPLIEAGADAGWDVLDDSVLSHRFRLEFHDITWAAEKSRPLDRVAGDVSDDFDFSTIEGRSRRCGGDLLQLKSYRSERRDRDERKRRLQFGKWAQEECAGRESDGGNQE